LPRGFRDRRWSGWEWRTDGVYFIGATQDNQIRMRYNSAYPDLTGPNDVVLIRGAQEAIAYPTAGLAGLARGAPLAEQWNSWHGLYRRFGSPERAQQQNVGRGETISVTWQEFGERGTFEP